MIVRVWSGRGSPENVERYCREHFGGTVLPQLERVPGFVEARLLVGDGEVVVETVWESLEAVRAFAGADVGQAVVEPVVRTLLEDCDERVRHYRFVKPGQNV